MFRLISILLLLLVFSNLYCEPSEMDLTDTDIKNLIICIQSENKGIRSWGVFFAGKYKAPRTVDHLILVLNCDQCPEIRKQAAYSLFQIGDERGIASLKNSVKEGAPKELKRICSSLYYASVSPTTN